MEKKTAVVVTTIFEPIFLNGYIQNIEHYGHTDQVDIIVIPDRKTPVSVYKRSIFFRDRGFSVLCPDIAEQENFLKKFSSMSGRIPYDSDNRRNVGYLMALERGADVLISIDDDNYCIQSSDFIAEHAVVGHSCDDRVIESSDYWFNICSMLESRTQDIYPRGFPYFARQRPRELIGNETSSCRVAMNAGLWLNDPDVDAISRLAQAPKISQTHGNSVLLSSGTWSPINTQNTALMREAVAAYYYIRMGYPIGGMSIDRFGDILSGYFCQKCAKSLGDLIRIGGPVVDHQRTQHNLFKDLYHELAGIVIIEDILPWLMETKITGSSYAEAYSSLTGVLEENAEKFKGFVWDQGGCDFLRETAGHMRAWLETVRAIG